MIEIKYIANCYMFECLYNRKVDDYLLNHGIKSVIFEKAGRREENHYCDVLIFDTYLRESHYCFYDLSGWGLRKIDSSAVMRILEALCIDVDNADLITHININDVKRVYKKIEKGE